MSDLCNTNYLRCSELFRAEPRKHPEQQRHKTRNNGVSQQNMNYEKFDKIKVKEAKLLVEKYQGKLVKDLSKEFDTDVYTLDNGQAVVIYDTHAFLHKSLQNIYKFNEASKVRTGEVKHILDGKFPYQQTQFLEKKDTPFGARM